MVRSVLLIDDDPGVLAMLAIHSSAMERSLVKGAVSAVLAVGCSTAPLAAQDRAVSQLQVRFWTDEDGLPVNAVTDVEQTPDGYIWIGTESGLARLDGVDMAVMDAPESPLHVRTDIRALEVGGDGTLWVATGSGLVRGRDGGFEVWPEEQGPLATGVIQALGRDEAGRIWTGIDGGSLFVLEGGDIAREIPAPVNERLFFRALAPAASGGVWLGTNRGLARARDDSLTFHPGVTAATEDVRAVLEDGNGDVWVGTREGLYRATGDRFAPVEGPEPLRTALILAIHEGPDGMLWVGTSGHGVFRRGRRGWEQLDREGGLPSDDIHSLFSDRRGDLWVGASGGVALVYAGDVLPITPAQGLAAPIALAVMEDRTGALWVGSFGAGVTRLRGEEARTWGRDEGLPNEVVLSLAEDATGRIWVGTRAGVRVWDGERMLATPAAALEGRSVTALLSDSRSRLWAGTRDGLVMIDGPTVTEFGLDQGLDVPSIVTVFESRDGAIFTGTDGGGAYRLRGDHFERFDSAEPASRAVRDFQDGANGCLWVAGSDGLARHCDGQRVVLQRSDGLPDQQIARILADDAGDFWISTNRGVFHVAEAELSAVADGVREAISPRLFTRQDGMPSTEANGGFHPAGWKGASGALFFPTMKGVAVFAPERIWAHARPPDVVIEGVIAGGVEPEESGATQIPPEASEFSVRYAALDFRRGDSVEFEYRLTGFDDAWVAAGTRRTAYYTNLSPGRYTFSVRGRLPGGSWSPAAHLPLRLRAHFWQMPWFRVLLALLIAGGALLLHRWTVRSLRAREVQLLDLVRAREQAERRYRDIFENAQEVVLTLDREGRIEEANQRAATLLGRSPAELVGVPLAELAREGEGDGERDGEGAVDGDFLQDISGDGELRELTLWTAADTEIRLETSIRELREDGRRTGFQLIGRDVTEQHRLEERLRQAQRMEAVGQLAGGVAHDFNNLLTVIRGHTEFVLAEVEDRDRLRDDVVEISRAADRASALTRQLLAFSRRQVLQPRVLDLNEVVGGMQTLLSRLITEDIDVTFQLEPDLGATRADPGQIEQVIANLAVNARDAMPDGGRLSIRTSNRQITAPLPREHITVQPGSYVLLEISDTGMGMPENVRKRIFEPFFTTKARGKGTGLGLATVHGIVEQSHAHIWVTSELGKGTRFTICFPRVSDPVTPLEPGDQSEEKPRGRETVLVVEDEAAVRRLVAQILERSGYTVRTASDPVAALRLLGESTDDFHLLITDVVMPEMNGPDFAARAARLHPDLRTVFMSGYTEEEIHSEGALETAAFLPKPFSAGELLRKVRAVLDAETPPVTASAPPAQ